MRLPVEDKSVLRGPTRKNFNLLAGLPFLENFYLAGGTGCALQLGHRISLDLDFFSSKEFSPMILSRILERNGRFITDYSDAGTLTGRFNRTKISFIYYPYPLIKPLRKLDRVKLASIEDIGCMKMESITGRGKKRDFVDLYFILKKRPSCLKDFLRFYKKKYRGTSFNLVHLLKSLVYFDDAEKDPDPVMLLDFKWTALKKDFIDQVPKSKIIVSRFPRH